MDTADQLRARLRRARREAAEHSNECPHWDYENPDGCDECARLNERVVSAKTALYHARVSHG